MLMKKTLFFILLSMVVCCLAEAAYLRKVREPQFFIPEKDKMHKPEKLPQVLKRPVQEDVDLPPQEDVFEIPEYKRKCDKYLADIKVFEKTRVFPDNPDLESDLKVMETGEIFEVTIDDPQSISSLEQQEFYWIAKEILKD